MIRILVFALIVLALGAGFSWLADRPGELSLIWEGQRIETSLMVGATLLVVLIAAILLTVWLVRLLLRSPYSIARHFRVRKRDRGYQALSTGLIAAGAGDSALARQMTTRARGLLRADQEPLIHLLEAQTALIEGKHDDARRKFERMVEDPETRALGLRGLYLEAKRLGADEAARHYAEQAAEKAPQLSWATLASLDERSRAGEWDEAIRLIEQSRASHVIPRKEADRKKAVLLTARAKQRLDGDPKGAREDAFAALKLDGTLVPAAVIAAKALFREDNLRKAASVLEKVWRETPHPELADTYVRARSGDSAADRLKRAKRLEALKPNNVVSLMAVAQSALEARDLPLARSKAEAAARIQPTEGVFLLLADIEEADTGDDGRIRHWMNQALKSPRDPAWIADGAVSPDWLPVSPTSGRLDAFEWKMPVHVLTGPVEEGGISRGEAAIRSLPPVATPSPAPVPTSAPREPAVASVSPIVPAPGVAPAPLASDRAPAFDPPPPAREPAPGEVVATTIAVPAPSESVLVPETVIVPAPATPEAVPAKTAAAVPSSAAKPSPTPGSAEAGKPATPVEPFFGRPPDDPGVRQPAQKSTFRLF
ncbi:heme biosynthesis HemY N-terminal domain-containing protein [Rhizobium sp. YIM 134829]|uniref:heme biosynthesis protein HemY n=1 Tax=Rhizobium sp. YIM 134829 TaxID=3390453 RepID=UPI00397D58CF